MPFFEYDVGRVDRCCTRCMKSDYSRERVGAPRKRLCGASRCTCSLPSLRYSLHFFTDTFTRISILTSVIDSFIKRIVLSIQQLFAVIEDLIS